MKKRISPLAIGILLIPYAIAWSVYTALRFPVGRLENFTRFFQFQYHTLALIALVVLIWIGSTNKSDENPPSVRLPRYWGMGFAAALLLTIGVVAYINPHSRFDNNNFPHLTPGARVLKKEALLQLDETPDIILLGSSRAFTISPAYIKEQTQLSTFNMSVEGGRVGDFLIQLDYMLDADVKPDVIIIELDNEALMGDYWNISEQPLSLAPHMPLEKGLAVYTESLRDILGVYSLSDALFLLTLPEAYDDDWVWAWSYQSDGLGVRKNVAHQKYLKLLNESISSRLLPRLRCRKFDLEATSALEATIQRAGENGIAVLLYSSPINSVFYDVARKKDRVGLETCSNFTAKYLGSLAVKYPHVNYKDLSESRPIGKLEEDGFYDAVHLKPNAAQMVVDELLTEIELAYQWAQGQTGK
jgi:hypothetical protein